MVEPLDAFLFLLFHRREKDVLDLVELKIRITIQRDELILVVQLDFGRGTLEIIARINLAADDINGVFNATMSASEEKSKLGMAAPLTDLDSNVHRGSREARCAKPGARITRSDRRSTLRTQSRTMNFLAR